MHYVKVPPPVALMGKQQKVDDGGTVKLVDVEIRKTTMFDFIADTVTNDGYFGKNAKFLMAAMDLCAKFEHAKPGDFVELTDEAYGHVKSVLDSPTGGWNVVVMKQYMPFVRACLEALDDDAYKQLKAVPPALAPVAAAS